MAAMAESVYESGGKLVTEGGRDLRKVEFDEGVTLRGGINAESPFNFPTPWTPSRVNFGGIQGEARFVGPAEMYSPTGSIVVSSGCPVMQLADAATTDVYITIELEEWWLVGSINIPFEWTNLHSATGNVRFRFQIREYDIASELLSQGDTVLDRTVTEAAPAANGGTTTGVIAAVGFGFPFIPDPGPLASFYVLQITRLGSDGADTLAGPCGLIATSWGRAPVTG